MFLTWENVGVGLFCVKDITVPRRQVLFFCGAGGEKKGRMDSRWRRAGNTAGRTTAYLKA